MLVLAVVIWASCLTQAPAASPSQLYSHGDPVAAEQYMLQLVNRARSNPTAEATNDLIDLNEGLAPGTISAVPKPPLAFNPDLLQSARGHSQWMLTNSMFTHVETDGSDPGDRMTSAGYVFSGAWTWGENISWSGTTGPIPSVETFVGQEEQGLFVDSSEPGRGHRLNLLDADYREIGIGVETGLFALSGQNYNSVMITQDFAASDTDPGPFLVGVVYRDTNGNGFYDAGEGAEGVTVMPAGGTYYAVTSTSGGFAIPITDLDGTLPVTFSGGPLAAPVTKTLALTGQNVELDFELNKDTPIVFTPGSVSRGANHQFAASLTGPTGAKVTVQYSTDLQTWTTAGQVTLTAGKANFVNTTPSTAPRRFYRAFMP